MEESVAKPIELKNVRKVFSHPMKVWSKIESVKDLSFSMEQGEIIGFVGHNGAGKTTTIKMIMGFITPTSGEISVFGKKPAEQVRKLESDGKSVSQSGSSEERGFCCFPQNPENS